LIVGRLQAGRDKGHRALIDAWPKVISKVPDARLAVVGTGNDEQALREYAASAGLGARVDFLGFVPDDRMDRIWNRAWVLAMPSWGEGFGLVYIEAMRFGLPVVASVHDAAPEINLHSHTGFNVDLQRVEELPEVLIRLLNDPQQCAALGQSGHRRWRAHFSYTAFRDRFKPILYEAIN
jgi:phosphatidylinositol alpha-1,6-mannosyltransferase